MASPDEKETKDKKVPYGQLWRYATIGDKIMVFVALLAATGVGVSQPSLMVVFGDMTDSFVEGGKYAICDSSTTRLVYQNFSYFFSKFCSTSKSYNDSICYLTIATMGEDFLANLGDKDFFEEQINEVLDEMTSKTKIFISIGVGTWICGWIQGTILMIVSTRITNRLRIKVIFIQLIVI